MRKRDKIRSERTGHLCLDKIGRMVDHSPMILVEVKNIHFFSLQKWRGCKFEGNDHPILLSIEHKVPVLLRSVYSTLKGCVNLPLVVGIHATSYRHLYTAEFNPQCVSIQSSFVVVVRPEGAAAGADLDRSRASGAAGQPLGWDSTVS